MHLIQILLPLYDNKARMFPKSKYAKVKKILAHRFKGLTAYSRAAAEGLWHVGKSVRRDDIVVYEIMTQSLDKKWWRQYKKHLEKIFAQDLIVIRIQKIKVL